MLQSILKSKGLRYLRATYYFGDGAPYTCWDGFRDDVADFYLAKMKGDGFNCVILLIPEALPEIEFMEPSFGEFFWKSFSIIMDKARAHGLYVLFRLNYIWDRFPVKLDRYALTLRHHLAGEEQTRLKNFLSRLYVRAVQYDNFLYAFTTWEDATMYLMDYAPKLKLDERIAIGNVIRYSLPDGGLLDGHRQIVPDIRHPWLKHYLEFVDDKLLEFYRLVKEVFPRLSMELRCDTFPYYDEDGAVQHHVHVRAYNVPEMDIIGTYYGIYMGARNQGEQISAAEAFGHFTSTQERVLSYIPHAVSPLVFVDQFLFCIRESKFAHFARMDEAVQAEFIELCARWMQDYSVGYAVWSFQDYIGDLVSNSAFSLGLAGWSHSGDPTIGWGAVRGCTLAEGSSLWQPLFRRLPTGVVVTEIQAFEDSEIEVEYNERGKFECSLPATAAPHRIVCKIDQPADLLAIRVLKGKVRVLKASIGEEQASHGGYPMDFAATSTTAALVGLNRALGAPESAPGPLRPANPAAAPAREPVAGPAAEPRLMWPVGTALLSGVHKILYMPIAKNACTSLKRMMVVLSDSPMKEAALSAPGIHRFLADNRTGMTLRDLDIDRAKSIVSDPEWLRFAVLRNPFDRLVGGYLRKFVSHGRHGSVLLPETVSAIEWVYNQRGESPNLTRSISFREFFHYIACHEDDALDPHWRPQACYLADIEYDFIGRVEDMDSLRQLLENRIGGTIEIGSYNITPRALQATHRSMADTVAAELAALTVYPNTGDLIDPPLGREIARRYKADFDLYRSLFGNVPEPFVPAAEP